MPMYATCSSQQEDPGCCGGKRAGHQLTDDLWAWLCRSAECLFRINVLPHLPSDDAHYPGGRIDLEAAAIADRCAKGRRRLTGWPLFRNLDALGLRFPAEYRSHHFAAERKAARGMVDRRDWINWLAAGADGFGADQLRRQRNRIKTTSGRIATASKNSGYWQTILARWCWRTIWTAGWLSRTSRWRNDWISIDGLQGAITSTWYILTTSLVCSSVGTGCSRGQTTDRGIQTRLPTGRCQVGKRDLGAGPGRNGPAIGVQGCVHDVTTAVGRRGVAGVAGTISASAETGEHRQAGRRRGPRLQQPADGDQRIQRSRISEAGRGRAIAARNRPDPKGRCKGGGSHAAVTGVQSKAGDSAPGARAKQSSGGIGENAEKAAGRGHRTENVPQSSVGAGDGETRDRFIRF